jgi:transcriptional regulator with XRE-family HTH domain
MTTVIESDELKKVIGPNVRRLREAKGWTQQQFANEIGYRKEHISRVETGFSSPSSELLFAMADALGVAADDLRKMPVSPKKSAQPA